MELEKRQHENIGSAMNYVTSLKRQQTLRAFTKKNIMNEIREFKCTYWKDAIYKIARKIIVEANWACRDPNWDWLNNNTPASNHSVQIVMTIW